MIVSVMLSWMIMCLNIKDCQSFTPTIPTTFTTTTSHLPNNVKENHNRRILLSMVSTNSNGDGDSNGDGTTTATVDDNDNDTKQDPKDDIKRGGRLDSDSVLLQQQPQPQPQPQQQPENQNNNQEFLRPHAPISGYATSKGYSTILVKGLEKLESKFEDKRNEEKERQEDGYEKMLRPWLSKTWWQKVFFAPLYIKRQFLTKKCPGTLILVRHGESQWNANKTFTGWADPDLNAKGMREAEHAARLLLAGGYEIDIVFTSRLKRAIRTTRIILQEMNEVYLPVFKSWRLNERMYGALTGLSKAETAEQLGHELVQSWRGSLRSRPPPLQKSSPHWPGRDRRYYDLTLDQIPMTESLEDCMDRTAPMWEQKIQHELRMGRNVMVVAHANTLRGLVKTIDGIGDDEIQEVAIPTGIPVIYKFDENLVPIAPSSDESFDEQGARQAHMNGVFMEKPGLLKEALKRESDWMDQVPDYNGTLSRTKTPMTPLERSLAKLKAERELGEWAGQFIDPLAEVEDDGNDGNMGKGFQMMTATTNHEEEDKVWEIGMQELEQGNQFDPDGPVFQDDDQNGESATKMEETSVNSVGGGTTTMAATDKDAPVNGAATTTTSTEGTTTSAFPCITSLPSQITIPSLQNSQQQRKDLLVIIRHGKTEHNKLGLFTGWEDAPLAQEGIDEAIEAGRLLKLHGFEFDVVYTSWLSRAIETAFYVLDELDLLWLPIIKSWRLNERMYGELTGLSKNMVKQRHGEKQFKAWRRGYKVRPPPVSSFSKNYPGNDKRYQKYMSDIRYSARESAIRSIEKGKLSFSRKLPKSESLKDCMDRTIPYFSQQIVPEAINQGKRVLISSSENAIRGLLMHLCEIPEEHIAELEIPNGLPLIFDLKSKCIKLLDDGTGRNPLEVHNFGKAANYLFRPCENDDGSPDAECDITFMSDMAFSNNFTKNYSGEDQKLLDAVRNKRTSTEKI